MNADHRAMRDEIEAELARREQEGFASLVRLHGGMDGWHRACSARRRADPEHQLAKVVWRLLASRGHLSAAYWASSAPGDAGWRDERDRLREVERQAAREDMPGRLKMLDVHAFRSLLPVWRAWGRVILDGG